ncbi:helix-turn-helix transcriptional regulator [Exilibacterium tricleocarpae]|uniref:Helix-turn-helix transcriptional regulator n=1 Tax=Exilibacterium tricleocarpae TaxID=2591008 RepID=A0A545TZP7_9GAMM|nr:helix-turn-helix domain-containing protein [Exilibacterium tricleocarpae]TQV82692.1 helix-turn-helix transcriptional regulator [Exilibacterium tricleocarpae]
MRWSEIDSQVCSVARALAVVGDRWTLLIIRDCFVGVRRFDGFQKSLGITRHRLSDRLRRLVDQGILDRVPYQEKPQRHEYRLSEMGRALYPVILGLAHWGDRWLDDGDGAPIQHIHKNCGQIMHSVMGCSECGEPLDPRAVTAVIGPGIARKLARGDLNPGAATGAPQVPKAGAK